MAMPWGEAKREIAWQEWERDSPFGDFHLNDLFDACFRIQREASAAAGRLIPMVVENVKGAQRWVGPAAWHHGSFYLWGDVPALMPFTGSAFKAESEAVKNSGGSWFAEAHNTRNGKANNPVSVPAGSDHDNGLKVPGIRLREVGFNVAAARAYREGVKQGGSGAAWFDKALDERRKAAGCKGTQQGGGTVYRPDQPSAYWSGSNSRKAASAQIAKIPFPLCSWVARCFLPCNSFVSVVG